MVIEEVPSAGTGKIRYCLMYQGADMDISIRPVPRALQHKVIPIEAVAIDRAGDSDIGLCSVAIDSTGQAWARPEYILDQSLKTLTVYPDHDIERRKAYAKRMIEKFPGHTLIWGKSHASAAGIFDFDDVWHDPNRQDISIKKSYVVEKDGSVQGKLINPEAQKQLVHFAIQNNIPLYIVTARPESHKKYICERIKEIDGFNYDGMGGFKEENIYCLGVETYNEKLKRPSVTGLVTPKINKIRDIHARDLGYLAQNQLFFVDDEKGNLEPVSQEGYPTLLAKGKGNDEHLYLVLDRFKKILSCRQDSKQSYRSLPFFKEFITGNENSLEIHNNDNKSSQYEYSIRGGCRF